MNRLLLSCALAVSALAPRVMACGDAELQQLLSSAQTLAADTNARGERLLACAGVRDEAVQWLAFFRAVTGDAAGSLKADAAPLRRPTPSERERVLGRAKNGDFGELLRRIDERAPNYATASDAQLTLARALVRRRDFERGRSAYLDYLRLNPADARAEAEYLFAFIWEGRYSEASDKLAAVRGEGVTAYLRAAAERGRALVTRLAPQANESTALSSTRAALPLLLSARGLGDTDAVIAGTPGLGFYLSEHELRNVYRRASATAVYEGLVTGRIAAHDLHTKSPDTAAARASEVRLGGARQFAETFGVRAQAGYFSQGSSHLFGQVHIVSGPPKLFEVYAGATRMPLALELPLAPDDMGMMRDALQLGGRFRRFAEASFEVRKEGRYAPHERHRLLGRLPLLGDAAKGDEHLDLRGSLGLERHPRPSPLYNSDLRTITTGAGVEYGSTFASGWSLALAADYILSSITAHDPTGSTRRAGALAADARAAANLTEGLLLTLSGTVYQADSEADLSSMDRLNAATLGVVWQLNAKAAQKP